jgi:hypothetical protein
VLKKTKKFTDATGRNIAGMQGNQFGQAVQQYSSFAENGTELLCMKKGNIPCMLVVEICLLMKMVESIKLSGELEAVSHNPYSRFWNYIYG